ncbi:hypothetical protein A2767_04815 [Candidatus Roizmanbacteria bacterium RIFCSPHIGHO2_01_FULL_35_10]|uniref:Short-chain dehydrogenase n=1 Tax=Candidatus Roizmanbacteria bacterium RIFCSPLOWO2_01_FULL_35_13 TaxID=1802055 RepID=A0A1F7IAB1_9BACT|nr:MAG: hypothetical protein A2767_04815 [Candidatus Roizmanbacteria bacterium RIFCSPHIGHO2_01_FULL_35_10]OGK40289.1 MAG: hypothetical protein A3A74_07330 [Candidatus Roizmanbacteria bacterium RIFCSPLOWO2_01_FULL_35_13]
MELKNKVIAITGAKGGIGETLVSLLEKEKTELILINKKFEKENKRHKYFECDLANRKEILNLTKKLKENFTSIDLLINIAGIGVYKSIEEATIAEWDESFSVNVTAPFILTKELLPLLQKSSDSLVVNIGSGAGVIPMKNRSLYCSTKFAMRGMTLSLAEEFKDRNPKFCLITLGSTLTPFGIGKALTLEEKVKAHQKGAAYFTTEWVANKLIEIIKDKNRKTEIVLYPGDYGFGTWKKP